MFNFGFSYVGALYLAMLFIPNIIWTKYKPEEYDTYVRRESRVLLALERTGEVLVCICVLIFSDFNLRYTYWVVWLAASFLLMILYELYWVRYFKSQRTMADFYRSFAGIPVAGATLPVCAFFMLGIYGSNVFMMISTVILGIGHIGIHLRHRREACVDKKKKHPAIRVLKVVAALAGTVLLGLTVFITGCRNVHYLSHYNMSGGVDEGCYLSLGGQEQYVLMRGTREENPVIIYLHGGPSSPDSYVTWGFTDELIDDYTVVAWDQRGCGRTYFKNIEADSKNTTATFEQAQADLDELVDYTCRRFKRKKVIIMGHSYGTILGSVYALNHPEKVSAYVGVAQVVSLEKSDIYSYEDALQKADADGDDVGELTAAYEKYQEDTSMATLMNLRRLVSEYHPVETPDKSTWLAVTSPYFGIDDFRWFMKQLGSIDAYYELNRQLYDYTFSFDAYKGKTEYEMPVYFISGESDWVCPVASVKEYMNKISAPDKGFASIEGCGHNVQYSEPKAFAEKVKALLAQ